MKRLVAASIGLTLSAALVGAAGAPASAAPGNLLRNGGFEQGDNGAWSGNPEDSLTTSDPHSGAWIAWMGGNGTPHSDTLAQRVSIPNGTAARLTFWLKTSSEEPAGNTDDTFKVRVTRNGITQTVRTLSSADATGTYVKYTVAMNRYLGRTITLRFVATEDQSNRTDFQLDDVALRSS